MKGYHLTITTTPLLYKANNRPWTEEWPDYVIKLLDAGINLTIGAGYGINKIYAIHDMRFNP